MLNLLKFSLLNINRKTFTESKVKTSKHFPSSTREWNSSIYTYYKDNLNLIPSTALVTMKIIKSYFWLYNYKLERKIRTKKLARKYRKLSSNKIYISNGEYKHTNSKIIVNLYLHDKQKHNYILYINKLYIKTMKKAYDFKINLKKNFKPLRNKKNSFYKLINRYKYKPENKLKKFKLMSLYKSPTIITYINKLIISIPYENKQIIRYIYNVYKLLCFKYIQKNNINIYKYKLFCINTYKDRKIKLYEKNRFNKYKFISIKLLNINLKNIKINKDKLSNLKLIRPKGWIALKINTNKLKINNCYNKSELLIFNLFERYILKKIIVRYLAKNKKRFLITNIKKRTIKNNKVMIYSKFNESIVNNIITMKERSLNLLYFLNREKYLVLRYLTYKNKKKLIYYVYYYMNQYYKKFLIKSWMKLKKFLLYKQLIYINRSKYNYNFLQYLSKYLYRLYNKNIEYNLIHLCRFYLHSDILSEAIKLKINKNRKKMLKQLNTIRKKIKPRKHKKILRKSINIKNLNLKKNLIKKKSIVKNLSYSKITGFRLEAKGRLTRRYTASRSIHKIKYRGNLLDMYSSYKGLSTVLLKGNLKSNLQYTKLKSKSKIGSFGIKGWVSGT